MANQRAVEMLAFNSAKRTFAYKRLAQGLVRSLSAFSSFMREYLDPVVKADQYAQYVDDIGNAANIVLDFPRNIQAVFKYICQTGLKMTIEGAVLESGKLNSSDERFQQKDSHHRLGKSTNFQTNINSPNGMKQHSDTWGSWTNTESINTG